ncbi:MAG: carboxymethylenebutenolidase [Candidatus Azotimanducaceae bacterium]|jgi:carboxymethylenebutenolidase
MGQVMGEVMSQVVDLRVDDSEMSCYLARPDFDASQGILVCMHGPGVDEFVRDICKRLAKEGYLAIAPDLYHRQGVQPIKPWTAVVDSESIRDMDAAINFLEESGDVRLGVLGFCMGGRLAFLELAHDHRLRTGVIFHGGNIMVAREESLPSALDQAPRIRATVLGIFGDDDSNPSPEDKAKIEQRLKDVGVVHRFESYSGVGHAFLNFTRPNVYREKKAKLAWDSCIAWLDSEMRGSI